MEIKKCFKTKKPVNLSIYRFFNVLGFYKD
jgi:hypothetical protein